MSIFALRTVSSFPETTVGVDLVADWIIGVDAGVGAVGVAKGAGVAGGFAIVHDTTPIKRLAIGTTIRIITCLALDLDIADSAILVACTMLPCAAYNAAKFTVKERL
jgi:hypothetical protein